MEQCIRRLKREPLTLLQDSSFNLEDDFHCVEMMRFILLVCEMRISLSSLQKWGILSPPIVRHLQEETEVLFHVLWLNFGHKESEVSLSCLEELLAHLRLKGQLERF